MPGYPWSTPAVDMGAVTVNGREAQPGDHDLAGWDAIDWRACEGVAAATVLGHSWGGYLAMQLAARAPDRVSALVLTDPLGAGGDGGLAGFGAELAARGTAKPPPRSRHPPSSPPPVRAR